MGEKSTSLAFKEYEALTHSLLVCTLPVLGRRTRSDHALDIYVL